MAGGGFGGREHPLAVKADYRRQDFMVQLQDRQIKATPVLGHKQVDVVFVDVAPLQCQRLGLSETGEQEKFIEDLVNGIVEIIDR